MNAIQQQIKAFTFTSDMIKTNLTSGGIAKRNFRKVVSLATLLETGFKVFLDLGWLPYTVTKVLLFLLMVT